jgi:hypothetical protein
MRTTSVICNAAPTDEVNVKLATDGRSVLNTGFEVAIFGLTETQLLKLSADALSVARELSKRETSTEKAPDTMRPDATLVPLADTLERVGE